MEPNVHVDALPDGCARIVCGVRTDATLDVIVGPEACMVAAAALWGASTNRPNVVATLPPPLALLAGLDYRQAGPTIGVAGPDVLGLDEYRPSGAGLSLVSVTEGRRMAVSAFEASDAAVLGAVLGAASGHLPDWYVERALEAVAADAPLALAATKDGRRCPLHARIAGRWREAHKRGWRDHGKVRPLEDWLTRAASQLRLLP